MSSWGSPLLDPKKLQNEQFYIIDWIRKKPRVDVANLAPCCHDDLMYYWRFWEPWANAMLAILLPKLWFGLKNHDWHNCFCMSSWDSPSLDPKRLQNEQFYIIDRIRKKTSGRCCQSGSLPWWLWCTIGGFWEPWANAMLAILLPKLWFGLKIMTGTTVFACLPGAQPLLGPKKASKRTVLHNRLNKEKNPGRCCQSGYLLPWWWWCAIGGFGNPGQMLC